MSKKKPNVYDPIENKRRATEPPPPFAPPGDYARAVSSGAITKDETGSPKGEKRVTPPEQVPKAGGASDRHFKAWAERHRTARSKKLFADDRAQRTGSESKAKDDDLAAFSDEEGSDTARATSDELGIDVSTSITRKFDEGDR